MWRPLPLAARLVACAPIHDAVRYPAGTEPRALAVADHSGDGVLDVVTANRGSVDITVLRGVGNGDLEPGAAVTLPAPPAAMAVLDANRDRAADVVVAGAAGDRVTIVYGNDGGRRELALGLTSHADPPPSTGASPTVGLAAADLDGDGLDDLVIAQPSPARVIVVRGTADGAFEPPVAISARPEPRTTPRVVLADIDHDGRPDVLCGLASGTGRFSAVPDHVRVFRTDSRGLPADDTIYRLPAEAVGLAVADLDGDGHVDVAIATRKRTVELAGIGAGWLAAAGRRLPGRGLGSLALADLDGDALVDLIATQPGKDRVVVFSNLGSWHFAPGRHIRVGREPVALVAADLDGDGTRELVTANAGSGDVSVVRLRAHR